MIDELKQNKPISAEYTTAMQCINGPGARTSVNDANFSPNLVLAPDVLFQIYLENS